MYLWCLALLSCYFYVQAHKTGSAAQTGSGSSALQPASERSRRCLGKVEHPFHALILTVFQIQFCLGCSCEWEEGKDKCPKYDKIKDVFYWLVPLWRSPFRVLHIISLLTTCYSWMFLSAPELFTCCTDVNICIRANWYVCNVLWYISMSWVHLFSFYHYIHCAYNFSDSTVISGMFLVARAAKRSSFVFTCSWEHVSNALPQPIIRRAGDVNSDLLQITCGLLQGCTSNKEQNIITWLQASVLHLRRDTDWKHLCKLSWNILLSFQCGGGDFFYFFLQAVAMWFIWNYWDVYIF